MTDQASGPTPDELDVAAVRERVEAATEEPWEATTGSSSMDPLTWIDWPNGGSAFLEDNPNANADAECINHTFEAMKPLTARLEAAEARAAAAEQNLRQSETRVENFRVALAAAESARDAAEGVMSEVEILAERLADMNAAHDTDPTGRSHWQGYDRAAHETAAELRAVLDRLAPVTTARCARLKSLGNDNDVFRCDTPAATEHLATSGLWEPICDRCLRYSGIPADRLRPLAPVTTDATEGVLSEVRALHDATHWCFDDEGGDYVFEPGTEWWPCPTLAVLDRLAPVTTDATEVVREQARYEVKAAVEEWFTDISLDDLFKVKGWHAGPLAPVTTDATEGGGVDDIPSIVNRLKFLADAEADLFPATEAGEADE